MINTIIVPTPIVILITMVGKKVSFMKIIANNYVTI